MANLKSDIDLQITEIGSRVCNVHESLLLVLLLKLEVDSFFSRNCWKNLSWFEVHLVLALWYTLNTKQTHSANLYFMQNLIAV